jgi:broad specificity phosphatase PhoE
MTIHIIRHGETAYNRLGMVQGSGIDSDLNETGQAQARAFYEYYRDQDFQLVVTSGLKRTHQTAGLFIADGLPWIQDTDINEISWGEHEGLVGTPERIAEYEKTITAWQSGDYDASLPGGETARQLGERVQRFIDWIKQRPEQRILVCTHGRTMRALISLLKGRPLSQMEGTPHHNTGCYIVQIKPDGIHFELENDIRHLATVATT